MKKIDVICLCLKGFGNILLETLLKYENVNIVQCYTRKEKYKFVYYECEDIETICQNHNIELIYIDEKSNWDIMKNANLIISSSFHRILKDKHLRMGDFSINIHPSLLPSYKGSLPTNCSILNYEKIVGITAHFITSDIDSGDIIYQEKMLNPFLTDKELRKALSFLSINAINYIIKEFPNYYKITTNIIDSHCLINRELDSIIDLSNLKNIEELIFHIKAYTNYPMPKLKSSDNSIFIIDYENPKEIFKININNEEISLLGYYECKL